MSRSYKKHPYIKDRNKGMKALANRSIRRRKYWDCPSGMAYKKQFCSYDICDYVFTHTLNGWMDMYRKDVQDYLDGKRNRWLNKIFNHETDPDKLWAIVENEWRKRYYSK